MFPKPNHTVAAVLFSSLGPDQINQTIGVKAQYTCCCYPHCWLLILCCVPTVKPRCPQVWNVTFNQESNKALIHIRTPYHKEYLKVKNQLFQLLIWSANSRTVTSFDSCCFSYYLILWECSATVEFLTLFDHRFKTSHHQTTSLWGSTWSISKKTQSIRSKCERYHRRNTCRVPGVSGVKRSVSLLLLVSESQLL